MEIWVERPCNLPKVSQPENFSTGIIHVPPLPKPYPQYTDSFSSSWIILSSQISKWKFLYLTEIIFISVATDIQSFSLQYTLHFIFLKCIDFYGSGLYIWYATGKRNSEIGSALIMMWYMDLLSWDSKIPIVIFLNLIYIFCKIDNYLSKWGLVAVSSVKPNIWCNFSFNFSPKRRRWYNQLLVGF